MMAASHCVGRAARGPRILRAVILETRANVAVLWSLTSLFAFRVAAQLVQYASPVSVLPSFDAWQGSGLSYPVLLASQLVILILMISGANKVARGAQAVRRVGVWLLALGGMYFVVMAARLVLGLAVLGHIAWFAKPLPTLFHLVLAGYLLTLGHCHLRAGKRTAKV